MPTFFLSPIKDMSWHASWAASDFQGACLVGARDAEDARQIAAAEFRKDGVYPEFGEPWLREDLVVVRDVSPDSNVRLLPGHVFPLRGQGAKIQPARMRAALH
ncbi:hypothetical protein HMPREF9946_02203 [Acetobacteraceae bacterium AT-5844]|nr:hypothetical protein HMPREF9946_02203 [Acetobacteraceae bacterium AT-5844]